jgi:translation initiation factor IF-3
VKVTIMFRGRELIHPERGEAILNRLAEELSELAVVETRPNLDGRNMVMMLAPHKAGPPAGGPRKRDEAPAAVIAENRDAGVSETPAQDTTTDESTD